MDVVSIEIFYERAITHITSNDALEKIQATQNIRLNKKVIFKVRE